MPSKNPRAKRSKDRSCYSARAGTVETAEEFDPNRTNDHSEPEQSRSRAVSAPGVPVSNDEYERLKRQAAIRPRKTSKHRQEDPSGEH